MLVTSSSFASNQTPKIIVIGLDGLGPYGITKSQTVFLKKFMDEGSYTLQARGVLPTSSSPNWKSILSAATPQIHGVTSNHWERNAQPFPPSVLGPVEPIFPTIFSVLHEQRPELKLATFYHWEGFGRLLEESLLNKSSHYPSAEETTQKAADYILQEKPDFTFIHLDDIDGAGHGSGHGSPEYYKAVEQADHLIGKIIEATKQAKIFEQTIFFVVSDHGGKGTSHGGETLVELEVPFLIYGYQTKKGFNINHPVNSMDLAATVAYLMNVKTPYAWIGKPVKSAFEE